MEKSIPFETPFGQMYAILHVWGAWHGPDYVAEYELDRIEDQDNQTVEKEDFKDPESYYKVMNLAYKKLDTPGLLETLTDEYENWEKEKNDYIRDGY